MPASELILNRCAPHYYRSLRPDENSRVNSYFFGIYVQADLNAIWEYIAADNPDAADRWIQKLFEAFDALAQAPFMGHLRTDLTYHQVRFWPVGAYLVIYRSGDGPVEIVAVTQGSRDIPAFLYNRMQ